MTTFDLDMPVDNAEGSRTVIQEAQAGLLRTRIVFEAYCLVCPHLGCQAEPEGKGFACPCHGSRGELVGGPSEQPMRPLSLKLASSGHLILDIT